MRARRLLPLLLAFAIGAALGAGLGVWLDRPADLTAQRLLMQFQTAEVDSAPRPPVAEGPAPTHRPPAPGAEPGSEVLDASSAKPHWEAPPELPPLATLETSAGPSARGREAVGPAEPPAWRRHAVAAPAGGRPMVAIVLDDLGLNRPAARRAIALPGPLTLAFMTYAEGLAELTAAARAAGHELIVHLPMEPRDARHDAGPNALAVDLDGAELRRRLAWGLERFEGYVGINNHMGSRFTAFDRGMALVMGELKARGLLFLDSKTSGSDIPALLARRTGVPFAERDIFLDNDPEDPAAVRAQIERLERIARRRGYAVAIGHPHTVTLEVLAAWLPEAERRGLALVPISAIAEHRRLQAIAEPPDSAG